MSQWNSQPCYHSVDKHIQAAYLMIQFKWILHIPHGSYIEHYLHLTKNNYHVVAMGTCIVIMPCTKGITLKKHPRPHPWFCRHYTYGTTSYSNFPLADNECLIDISPRVKSTKTYRQVYSRHQFNSSPPGQNGRHSGRRHFQLHFLERK